VYHTSRNCFASIRTYNTRLSTRIANRTHAPKRAVSGLVIQITIVFTNPARRFRQNFFFYSESSYRSAGDFACKRLVRAITSFFFKSSCLFYFFIFCVLVRRATSFSILNLAFFLGNEMRPEGTVPPIVGGVEE
jgi:hypothetical protein